MNLVGVNTLYMPKWSKVLSQQGATRNWVGDSFWIQVGPQHRCSTWGRKCSKILSDLDVTSRGTAAQHRANAGWESLAHWNPTMCFFPQGGISLPSRISSETIQLWVSLGMQWFLWILVILLLGSNHHSTLLYSYLTSKSSNIKERQERMRLDCLSKWERASVAAKFGKNLANTSSWWVSLGIFWA